MWRSSRNSSISSATAARQTRPSSNTTVTASRGTHRAHLMSCSRSPPMRSVPSCGAPHDFAPDCSIWRRLIAQKDMLDAIAGGVSVDLSRMNRVLRVSVDDLDVTVEAGVTHRQLNKALANTGVCFWVDPGATIGGMVATGASGTTTVRYGTMRETVRGLTVVLADGRIIRTGGRARKSSAGYDLTRLFVGSEGTLGVITEITLRVYGLPECVSAAVCAFDSIEGAVRTVITTIQLGIPVARIELLDEVMMDAVQPLRASRILSSPRCFSSFTGRVRQA